MVKYCKRNGVKPQLINGATADEQLDRIIGIIRANNLTRACVLVPYNTRSKALSSPNNEAKLSVEYVHDYFVSHGMLVEQKRNSKAGNIMTLDFKSSVPKVISWHCAKGLQFNDVFIPFCEVGYDEGMKKALYVALTRAYNRVYLGYTGQLNAELYPPVGSEEYAADVKIEQI